MGARKSMFTALRLDAAISLAEFGQPGSCSLGPECLGSPRGASSGWPDDERLRRGGPGCPARSPRYAVASGPRHRGVHEPDLAVPPLCRGPSANRR
jgi:hypothetical protein